MDVLYAVMLAVVLGILIGPKTMQLVWSMSKQMRNHNIERNKNYKAPY